MNRHERQDLLSQCTFLRQQLSDLPADALLTRTSVEARLRSLEAELAQAEPPGPEPARGRLTFRGRPVVNGHGVFAEFGTKATNVFTDAVAKMGAALSGPLAAMGPVPNRGENQLLITSTAVGSFGFELEEHRPGQLPLCEHSTVAQALEQMRSLLESTLGTDEDLTDAVAGIDPRALEAVRDFLELLVTNDAACTLACGGRFVRFTDAGQVRRSLARLGRDNLHEETTTREGAFQGFLPSSRTFEFKLAGNGDLIRGRVARTVAEVPAINRHLEEPARIQVRETRVGNSKPRYLLLAPPEWLTQR